MYIKNNSETMHKEKRFLLGFIRSCTTGHEACQSYGYHLTESREEDRQGCLNAGRDGGVFECR